MATKVKAPSCAAARAAGTEVTAGPWLTPPWTMAERLRRIEALGQNISGHVRFVGQVDALAGTSAEAKERAVTKPFTSGWSSWPPTWVKSWRTHASNERPGRQFPWSGIPNRQARGPYDDEQLPGGVSAREV